MKIVRNFDTEKRIIGLIKNLQEMYNLSKTNSIDLEGDWATPLDITPLAAFADSNNIRINDKTEKKVSNYLKLIKFPNGCENFDMTHKGLPLCKLKCNIYDNVLLKYEDELIKEIGNKTLEMPIKLLTDELETNVKEHSKSKIYWATAQFYKKSHYCELCLVDTGVGFKKSYAGTKHEVKSDLGAINNAIKGISSKRDDRGHGIRTIIKIIASGLDGEIGIISGKCLTLIRKNSTKSFNLPIYWKGSIIFLRFKTNKHINYQRFIV